MALQIKQAAALSRRYPKGTAMLQVRFAAALFAWSGGALTQATQWAQIA